MWAFPEFCYQTPSKMLRTTEGRFSTVDWNSELGFFLKMTIDEWTERWVQSRTSIKLASLASWMHWLGSNQLVWRDIDVLDAATPPVPSGRTKKVTSIRWTYILLVPVTALGWSTFRFVWFVLFSNICYWICFEVSSILFLSKTIFLEIRWHKRSVPKTPRK